MATIDQPSTTQEQDDAAAVRRHFAEGKRITDPGLLKRIRSRSEAARKAVFERNGLLDIAVPYIRELRDGEG
jgi:hypothetical protein